MEKIRSTIRKNVELLKKKNQQLGGFLAIQRELNEKNQKIKEKQEHLINLQKNVIAQEENIEQKRVVLKILQKRKNEVDDVKESIVRYDIHITNLSKQSRDLSKLIKNRFEGEYFNFILVTVK